MRQRANLWARGDVAGLRAFALSRTSVRPVSTPPPACRPCVSARAQIRTDLIETWLRAADTALAHNRCTFAVLPIGEATKPDGWIARLRERGYGRGLIPAAAARCGHLACVATTSRARLGRFVAARCAVPIRRRCAMPICPCARAALPPYADRDLLVCPDCGPRMGGRSRGRGSTAPRYRCAMPTATLVAGDSVVVIKDLKVKGPPFPLKRER